MTALILYSPSTAFTVTSATNLAAATPKENLTKDMLGLDCRFTAATVIVLDRGGSAEWDTIAFVQSTIDPAATVLVETSSASNFTGAVAAWGTATVPVGTVSSSRRKCHFHRINATTHRYVRITFGGAATSGFDLGRILIGKALTFDGITGNARRLIEDRSPKAVFGAYTSVVKRPILSGWKFSTTWMTETFCHYTWQPFLQTVGQSENFLFIPRSLEPNTVQADWCYGNVMTAVEAEYVGTNTYTTEMHMMGIYP